ncbi:hypothetical protein MPSEU_000098100 [Mayamaea pseudoterrestris]|nr:hypothetical protein MPSEU_000097400 [Mayamaea pseudoterrestris]GKY91255.1 hypothetical protein MPSEU_000098100 [Mayamaea pseudoterrestris]
MMQPISPKSEREIIIRRTSSTVAPRSASSALEVLDIDAITYDSKCPPMKLRSHQLARLRNRLKSLFGYLCGLVALVLFVNLVVGTKISGYLGNSHIHLKNETETASTKNGRKRITRAPSKPPTLPPTKLPDTGKMRSSRGSNLTSNSPLNDNPWFEDDALDSQATNDKPLTPMVANASAIFTERWCDLHGVDWMPSKTNIWQRNVPYFMIPGAKYSGTLELAQELVMHPSIVQGRSLEPAFFFQHNFQRYVSANHDKTKVLAARSRMYARDYPLSAALKQPKSKLVSFDATPGYLFYSSTLPRRVLCVMPWVRMVIVLRNPVDRVWEHYQGAKTRGLTLTLEEWVDKEFFLMEQVGLLNATSKEENYAWHDYQRATLEGAIGRSLYDIQLRQWFQALRAIGRNPSKTVYVVRADDLALNPQKEYSAILKFLQLTDAPLRKPAAWNRFLNNQAEREGMDANTRRRLEMFFTPYSKRLKSVLRRYRVRTGGNLKRF